MNKNNGLKNESFVDRLNVSGSIAIRTKNDFGVHIFSGSVSDDGVIGSTLVKPKYNIGEIEKSLDVTIIELIPVIAPELPDTVLRSIYNLALAQIADLTEEVAVLNGVILNLESDITELEIVTQSLRVQLDGKDLLIASLENENQQANFRIQSSIVNLQNSIQRATSEAIQRVSLTARNESLVQENEGLRLDLNETRARLEQSVKDLIRESTIDDERQKGAVGNDDILATPSIEEQNAPAIAWRGKPKNFTSPDYDVIFENGKNIQLFNPNTTPMSVNVTYSGFENAKVYGNITQITVPPNGRFTLKLTANVSVINDKLRRGSDKTWPGKFTFRTPNGTFSIDAAIQIQRGNKFSG